MRWLGHIWTVALNCFYLFVVGYVFDKLDTKPEIVTVAILGLIYVAVRMIGIGQFMVTLDQFTQVNKQLLYIRKLLRDPEYEENQRAWNEAEKTSPHKHVDLYIGLFFLWLIGAFCLIVLFTHL